MDLRAQENLFGGLEKWQRIQLQQPAVQPAGTKVLLDTGTIRVRYRGTYVKIPVLYIRVLSGVLDLYPDTGNICIPKYTQIPVTYVYR